MVELQLVSALCTTALSGCEIYIFVVVFSCTRAFLLPPLIQINTYTNTHTDHNSRRIDFRELVRDLFSLYKTRIWMQQLEPETNPSGAPMQQSSYSPQEMHRVPDPQAVGQMNMGGMNMGGPML